MLMDTIFMIKATVELIGGGEDHIASLDGENLVPDAEGYISAQINIDLIEIMKMIGIVPDIIDGCELLFIVNFHRDWLMAEKKWKRPRNVGHERILQVI